MAGLEYALDLQFIGATVIVLACGWVLSRGWEATVFWWERCAERRQRRRDRSFELTLARRAVCDRCGHRGGIHFEPRGDELGRALRAIFAYGSRVREQQRSGR